VAGCRETVDARTPFTGEFAKEFAKARALAADQRDVTRADLAEI
jgi:hypothetical protein